MVRFNRKHEHPRTARSLRVVLSSASLAKIITIFLALIAAISAIIAGIMSAIGAEASTSRTSFLLLWLQAVRATLGIETLVHDPARPAQQAMATLAAALGACFPPLILAVAAIRFLSLKMLVWRRSMNVLLAAELQRDGFLGLTDPREAVFQVRFYKRIPAARLLDLKVEAFLRFIEASPIDGSTYYRRRQLQVLDVVGQEADFRVFPISSTTMPLTLWIRSHDALADGTSDLLVASIQGHQLTPGREYTLHVKLTGKVAGVGFELSDEKEYSLASDVQIGRAAPIEPIWQNPHVGAGWGRFDEAATYGIFIYAALADLLLLRRVLGRSENAPVDAYRASLVGWQFGWTVCLRLAGTSVDTRILLPNIEPKLGDATPGIVVPVQSSELMTLDGFCPLYERRAVTGDILPIESQSGLPDVVWTYVGTSAAVQAAREGILGGRACIARQDLERLARALSQHDSLLADSAAHPRPSDVPVIDLPSRDSDSTSSDYSINVV